MMFGNVFTLGSFVIHFYFLFWIKNKDLEIQKIHYVNIVAYEPMLIQPMLNR
jgi:hypothetical protein